MLPRIEFILPALLRIAKFGLSTLITEIHRIESTPMHPELKASLLSTHHKLQMEAQNAIDEAEGLLFEEKTYKSPF